MIMGNLQPQKNNQYKDDAYLRHLALQPTAIFERWHHNGCNHCGPYRKLVMAAVEELAEGFPEGSEAGPLPA